MMVKEKRTLGEYHGAKVLQFMKYFEATAVTHHLRSLFGALTDGEVWYLCRFTRSVNFNGDGKHQLQVEKVLRVLIRT
jgi:hypothetical protein